MVEQFDVPPGTIVVGVDSSEPADQALAWAIREAHDENLSLTLVHAAGPAVEAWVDVEPIDLREVIDTMRATGQAVLDRARAEVACLAPEVVVHEVLRLTGPHHALLELATDAAMIVVGSHADGAHDRPLIESAVGFVAGHAPCPVIVPRAHGDRADLGVVVICDGTSESTDPLEYACSHAWRSGLPVTVIHALPDPPLTAVATDIHLMDETARMEEDLGPCLLGFERILLVDLVNNTKRHWPGVEIRMVLEDGAIDDCLSWVAGQAQMLVIGAHHARRVSEQVIGAVPADEVRCCTVILPQEDRAEADADAVLRSIGIELPDLPEETPVVDPGPSTRKILVPVRVPLVRRVVRTLHERRELPPD
jgi:nucleotide-binding universal stress UspA family protein